MRFSVVFFGKSPKAAGRQSVNRLQMNMQICCVAIGKAQAACAQSFALWQQATT